MSFSDRSFVLPVTNIADQMSGTTKCHNETSKLKCGGRNQERKGKRITAARTGSSK